MDYKALERLAKACRKAGIKHFKNAEMEFTLADDAPAPKPRGLAARNKQVAALPPGDKIETDSLTEDELLMWSVSEVPEITGEAPK